MAKWFQSFSLLAATLIKQPEGKGQTKYPSGSPEIAAQLPENIRESDFDFTARLGEINPDVHYLCTTEVAGQKRAIRPFYSLFSLFSGPR